MQLADAARITYNRYWRIENEHAEPSDDEQRALAEALNVPLAIVFPAFQESVA